MAINKTSELEFGESALENAPCVQLSNGNKAIPQQFFNYQRDKANVEKILEHVHFSDDYLLFVNHLHGALYLQVGIIGLENYPGEKPNNSKIVYGRMWLIEPNAPSSEVVQTALLAIKKAREHELREHVILNTSNGKATPFNTHLDLPLMASNPHLFKQQEDYWSQPQYSLKQLLQHIRIQDLGLTLQEVILRKSGQCLIDLEIEACSSNHCLFPELPGRSISLLCEQANNRSFLHQLMQSLLQISDAYIDEQFSFKGFYRFSTQHSPEKLANFSINTRKAQSSCELFQAQYKHMLFQVDSARAPRINAGRLGQQQTAALNKHSPLDGYLPANYTQAD